MPGAWALFVLADAETLLFREIGKAKIIAGRERRTATPTQANNVLNTMRSLFKWAIANDFLDSNKRAVDKLQKNEPSTSYAQPDQKVGREGEN